MKKNTRILIVAVALILIIAIVLVIGNKQKRNEKDLAKRVEESIVEDNVRSLEDGTKLNTSKELEKTKKIDGLEITNIQLKENGGITTLIADVKNPTKQDKEKVKIKVETLDETGKTIVTLRGKIEPIKAGETTKLNMAVTVDVANAYDFKITKE